MITALIIVSALVLVPAAVAMALRNVIHSALLLVASWFGVAAFYLWAGAEFVAFAQVLIYVGAISMVVVFAVLLTRRSLDDQPSPTARGVRLMASILPGASVAAVLAAAIAMTDFTATTEPAPTLTVRQLGEQLLGVHAAALLLIGVILTVALIGAVVIASANPSSRKGPQP